MFSVWSVQALSEMKKLMFSGTYNNNIPLRMALIVKANLYCIVFFEIDSGSTAFQ